MFTKERFRNLRHNGRISCVMGMAVVGPQDTNGGGRRHGDLPTTVRHGFASIATGRQCLPSDLKPQATINKLLMAVRKETNDSKSTGKVARLAVAKGAVCHSSTVSGCIFAFEISIPSIKPTVTRNMTK